VNGRSHDWESTTVGPCPWFIFRLNAERRMRYVWDLNSSPFERVRQFIDVGVSEIVQP